MAATSTAPSPITNTPTAAKFTLLSMGRALRHALDVAAARGVLLRGAGARRVEVRADVGMLHARELGHRADPAHLAAAQHGHAVGDLPQQVEVVRDDDHRE